MDLDQVPSRVDHGPRAKADRRCYNSGPGGTDMVQTRPRKFARYGLNDEIKHGGQRVDTQVEIEKQDLKTKSNSGRDRHLSEMAKAPKTLCIARTARKRNSRRRTARRSTL